MREILRKPIRLFAVLNISMFMARVNSTKVPMASVAFHLNTQINKGENPKLFAGSEHFLRDFIYVGDVAAVNIWAWQKWPVSGIFNLGTGKAQSF